MSDRAIDLQHNHQVMEPDDEDEALPPHLDPDRLAAEHRAHVEALLTDLAKPE
ncbi:hypothetical protein MKK70_18095 [Methylobacterium sp. E-041]|nr:MULTISPECIES: hypothetical protein [unclassified Methylobacterium]MCJ2020903.1 hypothetical protein [Methylobacterium sp. E-065]MCJ2107259.1 hypothetical protein [Methylobacterium sp. E-041]MCJ2116151.1 hypothetical protein [Methylobacterium sp. J-001]MCJ2130342.1 hypothetical protein [Methylobacterium sp. E-045]